MSDILDQIVADKREEIAALMSRLPLERVREQAAAREPARPFAAALRNVRPRGSAREANVIAELKLRSPSKGTFAWHGDVVRQVTDYQRGGARAVSVLTDHKYFGGSVELLQQVRGAVTLPVLQKEFIVEPWQVHYARAIGADAVLLIAAILPGGRLGETIALAREVGLGTLVEVVNEEEFRRATEGGAEVVGVNNRDLRTFTVDMERTLRLIPLCRDDQVLIAESGIQDRAVVSRMLAAGVDGFLIGETLMTAPRPAETLAALRAELPAEAAS
ncbi:MAG: indole-3-glycerol phosphate synthase TrpC [bacterium]